ncbi:hypothetical protein [Massilia niabensis]|uniref:GGDEF domain-containing protein n=1 Tax=Massilia niabensis TaxID=544910 RepID=A0ABW0LB69_9BURK
MTFRIGIASFSAGRLDDATSLIEAADRALYAAKGGGREQVVLEAGMAFEWPVTRGTHCR